MNNTGVILLSTGVSAVVMTAGILVAALLRMQIPATFLLGFLLGAALMAAILERVRYSPFSNNFEVTR